ncbi:hypothetical protein AG0111_0g1164 [Alternaria gaisen]|uniref:Uncharacterized protein n=1 Tax=Alternaria gaisen TaxID=167740 RepID=A0ACB6G561_9PLEO|nr:hypothetical protein AG0111_0g1164 [Alternaria gaisen]
MSRGVLWVSSRIVHPDKLSAEKFCDWYENTHAKEVLVLPGVPSAARYTALQQKLSRPYYSNEAPWLTLYEFPDLSYKDSQGFKGIKPPGADLIEDVYKNVRFDIRFYEEVQVVEGSTPSPPKFLISAALDPPKDAASTDDFDAWYRQEHIPMLERAPGFVRSRRFKLSNATVINEFQVGDVTEEAPRFLALHEFSGEALPWKEIAESTSTEWAKRVWGGLEKEEVGWYEVGKVYSESEWGHVGK